MKRCHLCKGFIWPWDRVYWVRHHNRNWHPNLQALYWHKRCRAAFDRILQEDADAWEQERGA